MMILEPGESFFIGMIASRPFIAGILISKRITHGGDPSVSKSLRRDLHE
jgi:hypothetical protein